MTLLRNFRLFTLMPAAVCLFALLCFAPAVAQVNSAATAPAPAQTNPATVAPRPENLESWSDISVASSHLRSGAAFVAQKDDFPTFTREWIQIQWREDDPIYLVVMVPKGVINPPSVLYLYSFPSEADRFFDESFGKLATSHGAAAVGFVSALTGHRFHPPRALSEWFVSELQESLATSTHDVQMVLNYLASRGDFDMQHVGMFGEGSGATIAILAAAADPRIKALDLLAPWGDWPGWIAGSSVIPEDERALYATPAFLKRLEGLDPVRHLAGLYDRSIWLQFSASSPMVPKASRDALWDAAPKGAKVTLYQPLLTLRSVRPDEHFFDWIQNQVTRLP